MHLHAVTKLVLGLILVCLVTAQQSSTYIVTGPIIGKVTTTTARILFEFNINTAITVILTDPAGNQIEVEKNVTGSIPVPFAFEGLEPNTRYTVSLSDPDIYMTESYFSTLSGESGKLNFAVASCNDRGIQASKEPQADLWADLLRRVENNEISYLLQTGDQVYMDDPNEKEDPNKPYFAIIRILNEVSPDRWGSRRQELLEILRDEYRKTWGIRSIRETLAKVPSLTLLDDHQIRDDWGYLDEDQDEDTADFYYAQLARQVYYEYERQLREDIDFNDLSNVTTEYYYEVLNDIGFFFLDYRGIRTWDRPYSQMGSSQLGRNQTELLQQLLDPNTGQFANLSNFFLVSPLTVVFLVEALVQIGYYSINDAQESWSFAYSDEQLQLLDTLRNWKTAKEGRELTIISGDIHMGGYTDIMYDDDFAFLQFTTSSIASSAPNTLTFLGFNLIKEIEHLAGAWDYEHHDWTNKFNYGIIIAKNEDDRASTGCYLVKADDDDVPELEDENGKEVDEDRWREILGSDL